MSKYKVELIITFQGNLTSLKKCGVYPELHHLQYYLSGFIQAMISVEVPPPPPKMCHSGLPPAAGVPVPFPSTSTNTLPEPPCPALKGHKMR